jgi:hypothetical protein
VSYRLRIFIKQRTKFVYQQQSLALTKKAHLSIRTAALSTMKFSTVLTILSFGAVALAAGIKSPPPIYATWPLTPINFAFEPTNDGTLTTESVAVGLQKTPVG